MDTQDSKPKVEIEMCALQNRNESGTSMNQIITQLNLEQHEYLIPEFSSPRARFHIKYHDPIRQRNSTEKPK